MSEDENRRNGSESGVRRMATEAEEQLAKDLFPWRAMSPGEYMSRHGDERGSCGYGALRFRTEGLGRWLRAIDRIASSPRLLARIRARTASGASGETSLLDAQRDE